MGVCEESPAVTYADNWRPNERIVVASGERVIERCPSKRIERWTMMRKRRKRWRFGESNSEKRSDFREAKKMRYHDVLLNTVSRC